MYNVRMPSLINVIGKTVGGWTVLAIAGHVRLGKQQQRFKLWSVKCNSCGSERVIHDACLRSNKDGCGCKRNVRHGMAGTAEHKIWCWMIKRCYCERDNNYKNYGGRGIRICDRWRGRDGFANFYADMGPRPSKKHSIERKNNDGDYCPENCVWATMVQQARNTRKNRRITFRGLTRTLVEWRDSTGLTTDTIRRRLKDGWPVELALTVPAKKTNRLSAVLAHAV